MQLVTHKFSIEDYHHMGEVGILPCDKKFELIQGEIIPMSPIGFKHAATVKRLNALCMAKFPAVISVQDPIALDDTSEPEPDIVLLQPEADFYASRLPAAGDVLLLIEVSDTTLRYDRQVKLPLYAASGIPEVWIANLNDHQLEVYRQPTPTGYQESLVLTGSASIAAIAFPEITLTVAELLG